MTTTALPPHPTLLPAGALEVTLRGEPCVLLAGGLLWRPFASEGSTVLAADTHFGKDATFRSLGIAVPCGPDGETLARMTRALQDTQARRLVILGDFFHARAGLTESTLAALRAWRRAHADIDIVLVAGNHDAHAGKPPAELRIECPRGDVVSAPFLYTHDAQPEPALPVHAPWYRLGGHVHPACRLPGPGASSGKLPCFVFGPRYGILPALGAFTGTHALDLGPEDSVYVLAGSCVLNVTAALREAHPSRRWRRSPPRSPGGGQS